MRASLVSGTAVMVIERMTDRTLGGALLATALATGVVQAGRFVVDRREDRLRIRGTLGDRVIVLADGSDATDVLDLIAAHADAGWTIVGCVGACAPEAADRGVTHIGASDELARLVSATSASIVVASVEALRTEATYTEMLAVRRAGTEVRVHAGLRGIDHREVRAAPMGHDTLLCLDNPRLLGCQRFVKRLLDVTLAALVLVVTAPIVAIGAVAIKVEDGGPVVFRQRRVGRNGTTFAMPKLRSMSVDAERRIGDITHLNERGGGPLFKVTDDPRVTRVGRLLRATSIDELPQLMSVIRGEMSLIGPRPALPSEVIQFDARLASRHDVRPGVTGLWQVEERDNGSFEAYRRLDLYYVENWSLLLDLTILAHTVPAVVGRGWRALRRDEKVSVASLPTPALAPSLEPVPLTSELIAS
jgi:exopolysaccharide biosynthesis polyprenyl glycosylphosphotransferase